MKRLLCTLTLLILSLPSFGDTENNTVPLKTLGFSRLKDCEAFALKLNNASDSGLTFVAECRFRTRAELLTSTADGDFYVADTKVIVDSRKVSEAKKTIIVNCVSESSPFHTTDELNNFAKGCNTSSSQAAQDGRECAIKKIKTECEDRRISCDDQRIILSYQYAYSSNPTCVVKAKLKY